ncbi:hypothetical protein SPI_01516 [Niveomyces insectorum RCEF 264]|uniref:HNH nuclease domain-containing protein n=1 Tax=Niveomyces insectorum RCEF 264 TaxID=1081102 RepID=A0A162MU17_9HYPO|nr:hypothetical protein SPI_01516 [Niveomyces insectorum RCEF 264]
MANREEATETSTPHSASDIVPVKRSTTPGAPVTPAKGGLEKRVVLLANSYRNVQHEQLKLEAELEGITRQISFLVEKWMSGDIGLTAAEFKPVKAKYLQKQLMLLTHVSILRTKGAQLAGRFCDDLLSGTRGTHEDGAYIDSAIRGDLDVAFAKGPAEATRTRQQEQAFRKKLLDAYDAAEDEAAHFCWCPVAQTYVENAVAAHIVDVNVGERTAQALFGDDQEHIWNVKNGIILHPSYAKLLDSAQAVIVTVGQSEKEPEFRFFLLTKDIGQGRMAPVWGDELHGRRLKFKNDFRPSKRYLYFKFVISVLRKRRAEVPGYLEDLQILPSPSKTLWASPGPYLKKSILFKFSTQLGCLSEDEAGRFWGIDKASVEALPVKSDDTATTLATLASVAISGRADDEGNEEDETSDDGSEEDDLDRCD